MNIVSKLLLAIGIIVGASLALALGITAYVFSALGEHGISPGTSYSDESEYDYTRDFSEIFDTTDKSRLVFNNQIGKVQVIGWDKAQAEITGTIKASRESIFNSLQVDFSTDGDAISVDVPKREGTNFNEWSIDFVIHVPRTFELNIDHGVGSLRVEQINSTGRVMIDLGVGEAEIVNVEAQQLIFDAGVGEAFFDQVRANSVTVDLGIGDLEYHIPFNSHISAKISVGVGDLSIEGYSYPGLSVHERGFMSREAEITLGDGTDMVRIDLGMGDLTFSIDEES